MAIGRNPESSALQNALDRFDRLKEHVQQGEVEQGQWKVFGDVRYIHGQLLIIKEQFYTVETSKSEKIHLNMPSQTSPAVCP